MEEQGREVGWSRCERVQRHGRKNKAGVAFDGGSGTLRPLTAPPLTCSEALEEPTLTPDEPTWRRVLAEREGQTTGGRVPHKNNQMFGLQSTPPPTRLATAEKPSRGTKRQLLGPKIFAK